MKGIFITFEGNEASGKSTQIKLLSQRLRAVNKDVVELREPGGTPIGEEIRHTLKHSASNKAMTAEAELLLMSASRAQLIREVIRPALNEGKVVVCDRFSDSTLAYQAYGRELNKQFVQHLVDFAVDGTFPDLTLYLKVPLQVSELRRVARAAQDAGIRDRFDEADRSFFERVELGYEEIADAYARRIRVIDAVRPIDSVSADVWSWVQPLVDEMEVQGTKAYKSVGEWVPPTMHDPQ